MEVVELDIAIDELESRVERLRSLYEQYFMGIEKIPPLVAQKDVDRRIYVLRREHIRNTARRYKLQTVIQRYNTFQQYWLRITREIENGTYRRHVLRAERSGGVAGLLTAAERKRMGLREAEVVPTETETLPHESDRPEPSATEASPLTTRSPSSLPAERALNPAAVRSQIERDLGIYLDEEDELATLKKFDLGKEFDDPLLSSLPPARKKKPSLRSPRRHEEPASSSRRSIPAKTSSGPESQRTAHGLGPVTPRQYGPYRPAKSESIRPDRVVAIETPRAPLPESASAPRALPPTGPARGLRLPAQSAVAGRGLPPPPKASPAARPAAPQSRVAPAPAPNPPEPPKPTFSPRGLPSIRESVIPRSTRPQSTPKPPLPLLAPTPQPPPKPEPKPRSAVTAAFDRVSVERLAEKLREARKQTRDAAPVSVDALAKKLETTAAELRKTHVGKRIDFDVVIKDGKAIVKPIVR